jgi:hypothetical protein
MQPLRLKWAWLAAGGAFVACVVYLGLMPATAVPDLGVSDFVEHAAGYFALMLWFAGLALRSRWLSVAGALFLLGAVLEGLQGAMALGRVTDPTDLAANSLGIALGLALAHAGLGDWMRWAEARLLPP